jgi:transcriptional regulator with XRE-family HTH domain
MGDVIRFPQQPTTPAHHEVRPPLWREAIGRELRDERLGQERTLADVAGEAGVSMQYLSEIERGRKEPSSEVIGAVGGALGLTLVDLTARVTRRLVAGRRTPHGPLALAA